MSLGIGILDLQGGVAEHLEHLARLGVRAARVKKSADLEGLAGLVIPGGESTCLGRLLRIAELDDAIRERAAHGLKLWGTCAGAILLAKEVIGERPHLGLIDIAVERNAFGSQLDSFNTRAMIPAVAAAPVRLTFIRAPKILRLGAGVRSLLQIDDWHAAAEHDEILVTVFHPELADSPLHGYFAAKCGVPSRIPSGEPPTWQPRDWTRYAPLPG